MPGAHAWSGTETRAQVQREVPQARSNGTLSYLGDYPPEQTMQGAAVSNPAAMGAPRAMPVGPDITHDGYRFIGGEIGYIYVGPAH